MEVLNYQTIGKKVAFVKGNRSLSAKNIKAKVESIRNFEIIVPLLYVSGEKAVADGCILVDINGYDIKPDDVKNNFALIDGQHRFMAAIEAKLDYEKIPLLEYKGNKDVKGLLAEANIATDGWKGVDFIAGAALFNPNDELIVKAKELTEKGFPLTTISLFLCGDRKLDAKTYSLLMRGVDIKIEYKKEQAECILDACSKFNNKFVAKRYLIEEVLSLSTVGGYPTVCKALKNIPEDVVTKIEKAKADEVVNAIRTQIKAQMEALSAELQGTL